MKSWRRIFTCSAESEFGRFWHAGLNNTGSLLLVTSIDNDYSVWDIASGSRRWASADRDDLPPLADWLIDGFVELHTDTVADRFRIFGPEFNHFLHYYCLDRVDVDDSTKDVIVCMYVSGSDDYQPLDLDNDAPDWVHASFSDDGSIIGVLTPKNAHIFHRISDGPVA